MAFVFALIGVTVSFGISKFAIQAGLIKGVNTQIDRRVESVRDIAARDATVEGQFFDRNSTALTAVEGDKAGVPAQVLYKSFGAIIGYNSQIYGTSDMRNRLFDKLFYDHGDGRGCDVNLTMDADLNEYAYSLLEGYEGSITVMNANTGEIYCAASRSDAQMDYDVNKIDENFESYSEKDGFFLLPTTKAEDTAGSTFKILVGASLIENNMENYLYDDSNGAYKAGGFTIENYGNVAYGPDLDIYSAFNDSVNTYFSSAAVELGREKLSETLKKFTYNQKIETDLGTVYSTFDEVSLKNKGMLAQTGFGQGRVKASPLTISMTMAAVLNDGKIMLPYCIGSITESDGKEIYSAKTETLSKAMNKNDSEKLKDMLHGTALYYGFDESLGYITAKSGTSHDAYGTNHSYLLCGMEDTALGDIVILCDRAHTYEMSGALKETARAIIEYINMYY